MSEQPEQSQGIENLLNPTAKQLAAEDEQGKRGLIPERWLQIEVAETKRMQSGMEKALQERAQLLSEQDIQQRKESVRRYFGDLMQAPSFPDGPYASQSWLNLPEMLERVIDFKRDGVIVPEVDGRIPFQSLGLEKRAIISKWLVEKVQVILPQSEALRKAQLDDCFTNVTERQLTAVIDQVARSGLSILPESPKDHWQRIAVESRSQK